MPCGNCASGGPLRGGANALRAFGQVLLACGVLRCLAREDPLAHSSSRFWPFQRVSAVDYPDAETDLAAPPPAPAAASAPARGPCSSRSPPFSRRRPRSRPTRTSSIAWRRSSASRSKSSSGAPTARYSRRVRRPLQWLSGILEDGLECARLIGDLVGSRYEAMAPPGAVRDHRARPGRRAHGATACAREDGIRVSGTRREGMRGDRSTHAANSTNPPCTDRCAGFARC